MTDPSRPERDLDPAVLDELSRAFADHQRDRTPVTGKDAAPETDEVTDDLEPTAPTPAVLSDSELSLADLVTSVESPGYELHEPTPRALGERSPGAARPGGTGSSGDDRSSTDHDNDNNDNDYDDNDNNDDDDNDNDDDDHPGSGTNGVPMVEDAAVTPAVHDGDDLGAGSAVVDAVPDVDVPKARPIIKIGDADGAFERVDLPSAATSKSGALSPPVTDGGGSSGGDADGPRLIAIDDADLPDAVYVQGSLDGARTSGVIIIEDDGSGDVLRPESERDLRRGIEPRMRERRLAVKRARGRKRLLWVGVAFGAALLLVAALAVVGSGWFAVEEDQVTVTGNVYTDPATLQAVVDDLVGTPVLRVDTKDAEDRLRSIAWVEDARVRVAFPHSATIEIREREALTTYQGPDGRFRVLDRQGRVLDVLDMYPLAYVLISGVDSVDLDVGEFAPQGYAAASELAKSLTVSVRGRVDHISVTADGSDLTLFMNNGMQVRFGEARELITKLVRLETVLAEMRREAIEAGEDPENLGGPDIVIDVSTSETTR